jgi:hypothetical protein
MIMVMVTMMMVHECKRETVQEAGGKERILEGEEDLSMVHIHMTTAKSNSPLFERGGGGRGCMGI